MAKKVQVNGSLAANLTDEVVTADTDILAAAYTPTRSGISLLMIASNTGGVPKLSVAGSVNELNSGVAVVAGQWNAWEIPLVAGVAYQLQFSEAATLQISWVVK